MTAVTFHARITAVFDRGLAVLADLEYRKERLLRDIDFANPLHSLLAFFLLFEQLAFAGDVAAVALGDHVLADAPRPSRAR